MTELLYYNRMLRDDDVLRPIRWETRHAAQNPRAPAEDLITRVPPTGLSDDRSSFGSIIPVAWTGDDELEASTETRTYRLNQVDSKGAYNS
jgi:hypothetical protein